MYLYTKQITQRASDMITTQNNHNETVELTFINMTDDGMYRFYGTDHAFYFLEKGDFVDSEEVNAEKEEMALRSLSFTVRINEVEKKVSLVLTCCTRHDLHQLNSNTTIKDFNRQLRNRDIKATVRTKYEAACFKMAVIKKLQEIVNAEPRLAWF